MYMKERELLEPRAALYKLTQKTQKTQKDLNL